MRPLHILTWHVHGSYLYYLARAPHQFYLPVKPGRPEGYGGRAGNGHWPANLIEVPADEVAHLELDCVLYQSHKNYLEDQYEILSSEQRSLPRIYLEHDPPRQNPTDTRHPVDDPEALLVHVTHFNNLMWDSGRTPTLVIPHGVAVPPDVEYRGDLARGLVIVNGLAKRGRRLGADVFQRVRSQVPLDLVGIQSELLGGLGEIPHRELAAFMARYRFIFNPIRYTSLGLAVCEAMMVGLPVVGLATTEMSVAVENGVTGYVQTDIDRLVERMRELLADASLAAGLGAAARRVAHQQFGIDRFARQWDEALQMITRRSAAASAAEDLREPALSGERT